MKSTKFALALVAISLLGMSLAWAQGGNPPASTKESGETSGHGMTAAEQTAKGGGGNAEKEVKALTHKMIEASLKGDTSILEKYYADDALIIHGDGKVSTKAQEIADFKSGAVKYDSLDVREEKIRTYGDTVVANVLVSVKGTFHGKSLNSDVRATRVWVRRKGDWKNIAFQVTRIPASQ